jgi:protein-S-isoprenylcysteine O-methyltransferase Ste14/pimeloyl-ACP methyl ester carboxylesterase
MPRPSHRFARALVAFLALPGLVGFVVPLLLAGEDDGFKPFEAIGAVPLVAGTALLLWCVREFFVTGKGTLAPWDPPRHLVTSGPYRYTRNPMYVAGTLMLIGWAVGFQSWIHAGYAAAMAAALAVRVVLAEEPFLARTHRDAWTKYRTRVPRWLFRSRRGLLLALLALVLALPMAGLIYEAAADARAARLYPPPGTLVDVGGRRLHLVCIGRGEPTVLIEPSGFGTGSLSAAAVRERLAATTTVCSYDRMGMAWSDPGPAAASAGALAADLAVLQDRAKIPWPLVIVASSIGGLTSEMFARRYPERVAGLVFVDAATSGILPQVARRLGMARVLACGASAAAHLGFIRLLDPFGIGSATDGDRRSRALTYSARAISTVCAMVRALPETIREFEGAPPLPGGVPIVVLSASSGEGHAPGLRTLVPGLESLLRDAHRQLATRSTRASWRLVPDSDHLIASSQPDAVAEAALEVLREAGG